MDFNIMVIVFALVLVLPMDIAAVRYDRQTEIIRLADKCIQFRYQDFRNADITADDVTRLCVSQAIKTINRSVKKPDISEDVILHNLDMYRTMLHHNSGSENLHSLKQQEIRTHTMSGWSNFLTRHNFLKPRKPTDQLKTLPVTAAAPETSVQTEKTKFHYMTHNHRVKRNANNVLDWAAIYDFFIRLRQSGQSRITGSQLPTNNRLTRQRLVTNNRLTGPQRARAAISAIGPLPIGRRFTSPFTDPRTRGDPLPIGPLRPRLRRDFFPIIQQRGTERFKDHNRRFGDLNANIKFKSILTDVRTKADPLVIKHQNNRIKHTGINPLQIKHTTPQAK